MNKNLNIPRKITKIAINPWSMSDFLIVSVILYFDRNGEDNAASLETALHPQFLGIPFICKIRKFIIRGKILSLVSFLLSLLSTGKLSDKRLVSRNNISSNILNILNGERLNFRTA